MNLGFPPPPPPPFPMEQMHEHELKHDQHDQQAFSFGLNQQFVSSSSSSSASCHIFFNSNIQDHSAFYHPQLYQPHHHTQDEFYGYHGGSSYEIENKVQNGLKLSLWKKEDEAVATKDGDGVVKWMAKKGDRIAGEVKKAKMKAASCSPETDVSSSSYNHCNSPIRVCSDCHTTKTPLWRSGPKGPKSLCNACGIRQRKARRAMAASGGVSDGAAKVKEKMGTSGQLKKRCKLVTAAGSGSSNNSGEKKKTGFEDFLINLSNKIAFRRVFPQDEKEAAILLMALSSGLVHG